jgi:hypothetical protein
MLDCSREANVVDRRGVPRFERGVEGAFVEVRVDRDVYESEGVRGVDSERIDVDSRVSLGFLSAERCGGGGRCITVAGAESRRR